MAKRRESYETISKALTATQRRVHVLEIASIESPDAVYRHRDGRDAYTWRAYRLTGYAGGYLIGIYDGFTNKSKSLHYVEYLDTAIEQVRERGSIFRDNGMADAVTQFQNDRYNRLHQTA